MNPIAFSRPRFTEAEERAATEVIRSGWVTSGPALRRFEAEFAAVSGARHGIGVSSWTTGAFLVLKALGIGPGDEVIVPSLTFIASVNVVAHVGATPVFVDVDPQTFNIDPADVARKIEPRTRAIIPIDQIGLPCEIDAILDIAAPRGITVVQDAACAVGSRFRGTPVGSRSVVSVFSLHPRKVVTTGEGGMILTQDADLAARLRLLRHQGMSLTDLDRHGGAPTLFETYPEVGYNFRLTDIQAAIGSAQLASLPELLERRRAVAEIYGRGLANHPVVSPPFVPAHVEPNWQSYQVTVKPGTGWTRNAIMDTLHAAGIATRRGVMASHREPPYRGLPADLPATEACADECLQLPMHSGLTGDEARTVVSVLRDVIV